MSDVMAIAVAIILTLTVAAVVIPLTLFFLLLRQLSQTRAGRWLLGTRAGRQHRGAAVAVQAGLRRQWAQLASDAAAAAERFHLAAEQIPGGPLRAALDGARPEVDEAVAEAQRLASQGDRTERAYRDILRALDGQRRRSRGRSGPADMMASLEAVTRAQHESAERLAAASRTQLCQLQLVVARLHGLTAHALELAALDRTPQVAVAASIADRLTALRMATAEVETAAAV